jgi:predicted transcriptional regulator
MNAELMNFSKNNIMLMLEMEKKPITSREQKTYSPFSFYLNINFLRKHGLVINNGFSEDGSRKAWCLTIKGKKIIYHIKAIDKILHSEMN